MKAQSQNLCIPLTIMMGRETKETFTEFGPLFQFLDNLTSAETLPTEMTGLMPFSCLTNCDLSAQWKGLRKGGATKVIHYCVLQVQPSPIACWQHRMHVYA
jgi:hypothetical protein